VSTLTSATSKGGGPYRKPRADIYTFLLIVSLVALILAILCLYFEMKSYNFEFKDKDVPRPPAAAALAPPAPTALARLQPASAAPGWWTAAT
jgi:hypothetical protein